MAQLRLKFPALRMRLTIIMAAIALLAASPLSIGAQTAKHTSKQATNKAKPTVKKVLFLGDSMTGWLAERMAAWGEANGFEVAVVVWDGATVGKMANSEGLKKLLAEEKPDATFISLGMNNYSSKDQEAFCGNDFRKLIALLGNGKLLWIGPPSWPKHTDTFTPWISKKLKPGYFFDSSNLELPRQSASNPHPTREGMNKWIDAIVEWMPGNSKIAMPKNMTPPAKATVRPKTYIYKRMKESF